MTLTTSHMTQPMAGETRNGDAVFVRTYDDGVTLACVIDALGHGPVAADVADRALALLSSLPSRDDAVTIMKRLDEALRGTRGAAATLCVVSREGRVTACGVGNVTLRSVGTNVPFVLSPGILGSRVRVFRGATATLAPGDRIVIHSDGLASVFSLDPVRAAGTEEAARLLFEGQRKTTDDATVLVLDVVDRA